MKFPGHSINLIEILREVPDTELTRIARKTCVDHYSKVLSGKLMFYLLLYGLLTENRLSQRGLVEAFSSPMFKLLFDTKGRNTISHSSISDRLSVIDVDFFRQVYECMYSRFSSLYTKTEIKNACLQRVDSTLVADAGNKLVEGMSCGNEYKKKKMIKYTLAFDGTFASFGDIYKEEKYACESLAMHQSIFAHFKKEKDHASVYVFDRGLSSADKLKRFHEQENLLFIGRLFENRKLKLVRDMPVDKTLFGQGELLQDSIVHIYGSEQYKNKKGTISKKTILYPEEYRVIRFRAVNAEKDILLITNMLDLSADKITSMYKRRWDIEVFFRFLKQELNFGHFLSLNDNGIQVVLYMTMITAMLVMIYKRENKIGYRTAIRRMRIELENLILAIIVIQSGGDLRKVRLPDP